MLRRDDSTRCGSGRRCGAAGHTCLGRGRHGAQEPNCRRPRHRHHQRSGGGRHRSTGAGAACPSRSTPGEPGACPACAPRWYSRRPRSLRLRCRYALMEAGRLDTVRIDITGHIVEISQDERDALRASFAFEPRTGQTNHVRRLRPAPGVGGAGWSLGDGVALQAVRGRLRPDPWQRLPASRPAPSAHPCSRRSCRPFARRPPCLSRQWSAMGLSTRPCW